MKIKIKTKTKMLTESTSMVRCTERSNARNPRKMTMSLSGRKVVSTLTLAIALSPTASWADSLPELSPQELIASMSQALKSLNYEGTYVHFHGSNLTSMHILHASHDEVEFKRLSVLDAEECEIAKNNSRVSCVRSGDQSLYVLESKSPEAQRQDELWMNNSDFYTFSHAKSDRVAGRATHVVDVKSSDAMRYGYRFWIDTDTHMLLRSMMFEGEGPAVDQMMFTQIEFPEEIDTARFEVVNPGSQDNNRQLPSPDLAVAKAEAQADTQSDNQQGQELDDEQTIVTFGALPVGYERVSETLSIMPESNGPVRHVMFSDGMASISVYVEYLPDSDGDVANFTEGLSKMGTTNAFGIKARSALITAVGEAPEATVQAFATAVVLSE